MTTNVNLEALEETISNLQNLHKELTKQAQTGIKGAFESFLIAYPAVRTITWTQYTPYFNDGDECVFGVREPVFSPMAPEDIEDGPYDAEGGDDENASFYTGKRYDYEYAPNPNFGKTNSWGRTDTNETVYRRVEGSEKYDPRTTPEMRKAMDSLSSVIQSSEMESAMRQAFGNHVWVKAYLKDGKVVFEVNDYEHD